MKRYIKSSLADRNLVTRGRADAADSIEWNISDQDAYDIIHSSNFSFSGKKYTECHYDDTGYAESKGYDRGIRFVTPGFRDVLYGLTHDTESRYLNVELYYLKTCKE